MIYPSSFPENNNEAHAEHYVFNKIQALLAPDSYDVFYNTVFVGHFNGERLNYEIDFIVADIRNNRLNGILCIEVKGGNISVDENGRWLQNRRSIRSPVEQVQGASNSLVRRYPQLANKVPFGWAVCFPDVVIPYDAPLPESLHQDILIDHLKLNEIGQTIRSCFSYWYERLTLSHADIRLYNNVFKAPKIRQYNFVMPLGQQIDEDEKQFIKLTDKQGDTLRMASENPRIIVKGIAGSGKTLVAKEIAQKYFEQGKQVLLLCFNKVLANNIKSHFDIRNKQNDQIQEGGYLMVDTFHSFAYSIISDFDQEWWRQNIGGQDYWDYEIPVKIEELVKDDKDSYRYDVIIIDEGQDFMELWFEVINLFLGDDSKSYIFMDDHQNINRALCSIPEKEKYTILTWNENCRNTQRISKKLSRLIDLELIAKDGMPEGKDVVERSFKSSTELQTEFVSEVKRLIKEEKISPNQIVVLLNTEKENSSISNTQSIGNIPLKPMSDNGVLHDDSVSYTYISRYKGLEADVVFILDAQKVASAPKTLYTQASRAKHLLYIFSIQEE